MQGKKLKVVIDTNIWISFLLTKDFEKLDKLFNHKQIELLFSQELLEEFVAVAQRPKFSRYFSLEDLQSLLIQLSFKAKYISVISSVEVCRDEKDNFLLSLVKDGNATHLITGDNDLLILKTFGTAKIITITEFLAKL